MNTIEDSKILITGGAGFVGSYIIEQLIEQQAGEIVIIDNFIRGSQENIKNCLGSGRVKLVRGDIRDAALVEECLKGVDYCFHLAALRITHCAEHPREALEVMYDGTFNVLEGCVRNKIKRIIFASSASVYGQADLFPTDENHHPYNNVTLYGAAKMANELMLRAFQHRDRLDFNAVRYFNIYGPRMDTHGKYTEVLIRWYHLIKEGKQPLIFGDGKQTMDFVYIEDIARATVLALTSEAKNDVFNIASASETSLEELCFALLEAMGSDLKPKYVDIPQERQRVEVMRRLADTSKAEQKLLFKPKVNLKEGLDKLVQWLDSKEKALQTQ